MLVELEPAYISMQVACSTTVPQTLTFGYSHVVLSVAYVLCLCDARELSILLFYVMKRTYITRTCCSISLEIYLVDLSTKTKSGDINFHYFMMMNEIFIINGLNMLY